MNKNAYEIRLDILKLAHDELYSNYHLKVSTLQQQSNINNTVLDLKDLEVILPTNEEVLKKARELYKFVNGD